MGQGDNRVRCRTSVHDAVPMTMLNCQTQLKYEAAHCFCVQTIRVLLQQLQQVVLHIPTAAARVSSMGPRGACVQDNNLPCSENPPQPRMTVAPARGVGQFQGWGEGGGGRAGWWCCRQGLACTYSNTKYSFSFRRNASRNSTMVLCRSMRRIFTSRNVVLRTASSSTRATTRTQQYSGERACVCGVHSGLWYRACTIITSDDKNKTIQCWDHFVESSKVHAHPFITPKEADSVPPAQHSKWSD